MKHVTFSADDFGLTRSVNEAVERAHRDGILTQTSLMVAGGAAKDAVERAQALPSLRVGLHLVLVDGFAVSHPSKIADLVDKSGRFPDNQVALGFKYFFSPGIRRQLEQEIRAQFAAFAATGLPLDHANAHKHMHLHPTIGAMTIAIGQEFGLRRIRVPSEPPVPLLQPGLGGRALHVWSRVLRHQARAAGLKTNDHCFGIAWSGHMTADKVRSLLRELPDGHSEIYFHPAVERDPLLARLMPDYEHMAEFAALLDRTLLDQVPAA